MNNTNRLISSDNKGLASLMFEHTMNGADTLPGRVRTLILSLLLYALFSPFRASLLLRLLRLMREMCPPTLRVHTVRTLA